MEGSTPVLVDTSALIAVIDRDQPWHAAAGKFFDESATSGSPALVTSSLIVMETAALIQARFGVELAIAFHDDLLPVLDVRGVDDSLFAEATVAWRAARRRRLSLVDCVSLAHMRRDGIRAAFTFDRDFQDEGFVALPSAG